MIDRTTNGVLPAQQIEELIGGDHIFGTAGRVQPASLDLHLGRYAYRVRASFLPGAGRHVRGRMHALEMDRIDLRRGRLLDRNCVYMAEVRESLALPEAVAGRASPKSTTGRLDIFSRLLSDGACRFNEVRAGYEGELFVEIVPRAFSIRLAEGCSLMQLRLYRGSPECTASELCALDAREKLTTTASGEPPARIDEAVNIRISLGEPGGDDAIAAYQAKRNTAAVDLRMHAAHPWEEFWDAIPTPADGELILTPDTFYLMRSMERLRVPVGYAAEMVPFDPDVGEFRIHYAGFFDPGFGCGEAAEGTPAVLEVRSHESALLLGHGQQVGRLVYSRLTEDARHAYGKAIGSTYNQQGLQLAKQFTAPAP